jgi:FixJ family two-component response regulator
VVSSSPDSSGVIHLVDDEADIVTVAKTVLESEGYAVHAFTNPEEALRDIEIKCRRRVGMLITDVRMPGHSGFEVARRTRAIVPDVPVVFMTAFEINSLEFGKVFPSLGVNEFVRKPFYTHQLLGLVRKYIPRG